MTIKPPIEPRYRPRFASRRTASLTPAYRLRLDRGCEHLQALGARALAEMLCELIGLTGCGHEVLDLLADYGRLSPEIVQAVGGDRFPRRLLSVR
jgi:hypothetical protein